jgi:glucosamine--fructose-6-phosphate aminotransferase (isomerizing)
MIETASETRVFPHAMLREIYEQPEAIAATLRNYLADGNLNPESFKTLADALRGHERIVIAASGSSRHAGLAAEIMLEDLAGLTVDVEYASEYCYRSTHTLQNPGVIVVSQSGETADTLAALARGESARVWPRSPLPIMRARPWRVRPTPRCPPIAGKEKAIPATKSFTTQLVVLYLTTLYLARLRGRMTSHAVSGFCGQLGDVIEAIAEARFPPGKNRLGASPRR